MINECTIHIGLLKVAIFIPGAQSLKEKRFVVKSLKDKLKNNFNASISEIDNQDKWQTAVIGAAVLGTDRKSMDATMQQMVSFMEGLMTFQITDYSVEFI